MQTWVLRRIVLGQAAQTLDFSKQLRRASNRSPMRRGLKSVQVPSTDYQTPALEAARVAVAELEAQINPQPAIAHYDEDTLERGRVVTAEIESRVSAAEAERREDEELWNRFKRLRETTEISDADRAWMKSYSESTEGRSRLRMDQWFGPRLAAQAE